MAPTSKNTDTPVRYEPENDGIDHINIGQDGKTELGRMLSHFYEAHFTHPYLGPFDSMEGFWHYVRGEEPNDKFRRLVGASAYAQGKSAPSIRRAHFRDIIQDGNFAKINQNPKIKEALIASTLPITQYYIWGPSQLAVNPKTAPWLILDFEELRDIFKKGETLKPVSFENYKLLLARGEREKSVGRHK